MKQEVDMNKYKNLVVLGLVLTLTVITGCSSSGNLKGSKFEAIDNRILGRVGLLKENNVKGLSGLKTNFEVLIQKGTNKSGQFRTKDKYTYGKFEADIKIPDNDGLLNGFFLYSYEDGNNYEIDIEVVKKGGQWVGMTTIYNATHQDFESLNKEVTGSEDEEVFKYEAVLDFNPTADYHNYRIDVKPDKVDFYINNKLFSTWNESFNIKPMRLHGGTFYTHWLNKENYKKLSKSEQKSLKSNGYKAYEYDKDLESTLDKIYGQDTDYKFLIKNIKIEKLK